MFDVGKIYWFTLSTFKGGKVTIKGEVLEETPYVVKVRMSSGEETLIACARILDVNADRGVQPP